MPTESLLVFGLGHFKCKAEFAENRSVNSSAASDREQEHSSMFIKSLFLLVMFCRCAQGLLDFVRFMPVF